MRDRRLVVDAVARPELVLDAVDGEDERAREDVRELLALVGVVVSRIARLAGCDGDEQRLERRSKPVAPSSRYVCAPRIGRRVSPARLTCAPATVSGCAGKNTRMSTPRATASVCRDVSEIDERPRSTSDRKLMEKPVARPTSRSERPSSRRTRRIVVPTSAS